MENANKFHSLNGWQRLWVIYAVVVGLSVCFKIYLDWPPLTLGYKEIVYVAKDQYFDMAEVIDQSTVRHKIEEFLNKKLLDSEAPKLAYIKTASDKKIEGEVAIQTLRLAIERNEEVLRTKRQNLVVDGVILFFVLTTGAYFLGWSIAWIKRGFEMRN